MDTKSDFWNLRVWRCFCAAFPYIWLFPGLVLLLPAALQRPPTHNWWIFSQETLKASIIQTRTTFNVYMFLRCSAFFVLTKHCESYIKPKLIVEQDSSESTKHRFKLSKFLAIKLEKCISRLRNIGKSKKKLKTIEIQWPIQKTTTTIEIHLPI